MARKTLGTELTAAVRVAVASLKEKIHGEQLPPAELEQREPRSSMLRENATRMQRRFG